MQTAESTHEKPQINKTSVLWGKGELFPLWESLSVPAAHELFIFSATLCCPGFPCCSFAVSPALLAVELREAFMQALSFK